MNKKYLPVFAAMTMSAAILLSGCGSKKLTTITEATPEPTVIISTPEVTVVPTAEPTPIIPIRIITIDINGSVRELELEDGEKIDIGVPVIEGMRFAGWTDAYGNDIDLDNYTVSGNMSFRAKMLPEFGTEKPYLFISSDNRLEPNEKLSKTEFKTAMQQLISSDSMVSASGLADGAEPVTAQEIKDFIAMFYTDDEIEGLFTSDTVTKGEFAHTMNIILGRTDNKVMVSSSARKAVDLQPDNIYYTDLLEASVEHEISETGESWDAVEIRTYVHEYEPYEEMTYIPATEKGSVGYKRGPLGESFAVYTPYGYDPSKKYNVCVYLNGISEDPFMILGENAGYGHYNQILNRTLTTKDYIDFLIQYGYCDPLIIVSTEPTMVYDHMDRYVELLQYTVDNYSTFAASSAVEDISEAREHFAIAASSVGAQSICRTSRMLPDMFAYYGMFSGIIEYEQTLEAMAQKDTIEYLVMCSGGYGDDARQYMLNAYEGFSALNNVVESNYFTIDRVGHCWAVFDAGIRDLLIHFSPSTRQANS